MLECLSVARCNNLPLPNGVDEALFTRIFQEVELRQGLFLTFNDSWYSKVAMQPLFRDIINNIDDAIGNEENYAKLAIFMGTRVYWCIKSPDLYRRSRCNVDAVLGCSATRQLEQNMDTVCRGICVGAIQNDEWPCCSSFIQRETNQDSRLQTL